MSKTISITAKCSDLFHAVLSQDGEEDKEHDGYVPEDLGIGGGDYVEMTIDLKTGKIVGWKEPTKAELEAAFGESDDDEE